MASLLRSRQFMVFVAGGTLCALLDVGLMHLLLMLGVHYSLAASAGFGTGLLVNYAFHTKITFDSSANSANFARYLLVVSINYLLMLLCVALSATFLDNPLTGKLVSLPLTAVNGYFLSKYWIYK